MVILRSHWWNYSWSRQKVLVSYGYRWRTWFWEEHQEEWWKKFSCQMLASLLSTRTWRFELIFQVFWILFWTFEIIEELLGCFLKFHHYIWVYHLPSFKIITIWVNFQVFLHFLLDFEVIEVLRNWFLKLHHSTWVHHLFSTRITEIQMNLNVISHLHLDFWYFWSVTRLVPKYSITPHGSTIFRCQAVIDFDVFENCGCFYFWIFVMFLGFFLHK